MNPLEMLKKGISAINPVKMSVQKEKGQPKKIKPKSGYLGDTANKVQKRNKALDEVANSH
jgi:hypothetical protein